LSSLYSTSADMKVALGWWRIYDSEKGKSIG
jgi:hypothetical protein